MQPQTVFLNIILYPKRCQKGVMNNQNKLKYTNAIISKKEPKTKQNKRKKQQPQEKKRYRSITRYQNSK